jgi:hypothetical protein
MVLLMRGPGTNLLATCVSIMGFPRPSIILSYCSLSLAFLLLGDSYIRSLLSVVGTNNIQHRVYLLLLIQEDNE